MLCLFQSAPSDTEMLLVKNLKTIFAKARLSRAIPGKVLLDSLPKI